MANGLGSHVVVVLARNTPVILVAVYSWLCFEEKQNVGTDWSFLRLQDNALVLFISAMY